MKRTGVLIPILIPVALFLAIVSACQPGFISQNHNALPLPTDPLQTCTIFTAAFGDKVLFGNNEDNSPATGFLQVYPPGEGTYGLLTITWNSVTMGGVMGGINEKGLCWDGNALPTSNLKAHPELPPPPPLGSSSGNYALEKCATVEEVITLVKTMAESYNLVGVTMAGQTHYTDATGDAMVLSIGADGEFAFTRIKKGNGYLVSTNFNLAYPSNNLAYPCWRYNTATEMLATDFP
jgi:hypothetical protein